MGKDKRQTTTQTLDPGSQAYVDQLRASGRGFSTDILNMGPLVAGNNQSVMEMIQPFLDPYQGQVISGVQAGYDRARGLASRNVTDAAIQNRAYGGSRHGIAEGVRLSELDREEMGHIGGLLSQGFQNALTQGLQHSEYQRALRERMMQEPIIRRQLAQQFQVGGLGPVGSQQTQVQKGSVLGDIAGLGLLGFGLATGNPMAATAGAGSFSGGGFTPPEELFPPGNYNPLYTGRRY